MENQASYRIGGLEVALTGDSRVGSIAAIPGWSVFRTGGDGRPDIRLRFDHADAPTLPVRRSEHSFPLNDDTTQCRYGMADGGAAYFGFSNGLQCLQEEGNPPTMHFTGDTDPNTLRFALWMAYALGALPHMAVPVHASAVVHRGKAVLCLGESGTGKSTHTRLWINHIEGSHLLNDDSPIVRAEADGVYAYGSPWSGKTHCYLQQRVPLAALVRIVQAPENRITRLRGIQTFGALQPSCPPALCHDDPLFDRVVEYLDRILRTVPVYRLECRPDAEAAHLCHDTLFH